MTKGNVYAGDKGADVVGVSSKPMWKSVILSAECMYALHASAYTCLDCCVSVGRHVQYVCVCIGVSYTRVLFHLNVTHY